MSHPKSPKSRRQAAAAVRGARRSKWSVLVVGENPEDRLLLQAAAQRACPELRFVFQGSAQAALAYLEERERDGPLPSLMVLEPRLREMSGLEFLRRVRSRPALAMLKVMVWTVGREPAIGAELRKAGVEGFLKRTKGLEGWLGNVRSIAAAARRKNRKKIDRNI